MCVLTFTADRVPVNIFYDGGLHSAPTTKSPELNGMELNEPHPSNFNGGDTKIVCLPRAQAREAVSVICC